MEWVNNGRAPGTPRPVFVGPKDTPYVFRAPDRADVRAARAPSQQDAGAAGAGAVEDDAAAGAGHGAAAAKAASGGAGDGAAARKGVGDVPAFQVPAGSFQCVWFAGLGKAHQKVMVEWWRQRHADSAACVIVGEVGDLPLLTAAKKLTPAERRWRKKQALLHQQGLAGQGQGADGDCAASAAAGGRPGAGGRGQRSSGRTRNAK